MWLEPFFLKKKFFFWGKSLAWGRFYCGWSGRGGWPGSSCWWCVDWTSCATAGRCRGTARGHLALLLGLKGLSAHVVVLFPVLMLAEWAAVSRRIAAAASLARLTSAVPTTQLFSIFPLANDQMACEGTPDGNLFGQVLHSRDSVVWSGCWCCFLF